MELAKDYTKADVKVVPAFSVLGQATNFPDDAAKAYMSNKLAWFILHDNKEAMMTQAIQDKIIKFATDFKPHCENDDAEKDLELAYAGAADCLMSPGLTSSQGNFYMMGSFKCKDEEATKTAMEIIKKHGEETLANEKEGFIGTMVIPPAAIESDMEMVQGCEKEDLDTLHVTYLMAFKTEAAWHEHEKKEYWGPFLMGLVDKCMEKDEAGEPNMAALQFSFISAMLRRLRQVRSLKPRRPRRRPRRKPRRRKLARFQRSLPRLLARSTNML